MNIVPKYDKFVLEFRANVQADESSCIRDLTCS